MGAALPGFEPAPEPYHLDPALVEKVIHQESRGDPNATSPTGARGLMQVLPSTARSFGFDPDKLYDPDYNRIAGSTILTNYINQAGGDVHEGLVYYKEGPAGAHGQHRPRGEQYADAVLGLHNQNPVFSDEGPQYYKKAYLQNREFATGGPYRTDLQPEEESVFRQWLNETGNPSHFDPDRQITDYDMRGYWKDVASKGGNKAGINEADGRLHFPDTYKTPYDTTFSAESKYAKPDAPFKWKGNRLVDTRTGKLMFASPQRPIPGFEAAPAVETGALDPAKQGEYSKAAFGRLKDVTGLPGEIIRGAVQPALETVLGEQNAPPLAQAVGGALGGMAMAVPEAPPPPVGGVEYIPPEQPSMQQPPPRAQQPGPISDVQMPPPANQRLIEGPVVEPEDEEPPPPHINDIALMPAIRAEEQVVSGNVGDTHQDIIGRTPNLPARVEHGFVAKNGEFLPRERARKILNRLGANLQPGQPEAIDMAQRALPPPQRAQGYQASKDLTHITKGDYGPAYDEGPFIRSFPTGQPGLSLYESHTNEGGMTDTYHVYRDSNGQPVAAAAVTPYLDEPGGKHIVSFFGIDKSRGLLARRAAGEIVRQFTPQTHTAVGPFSIDSERLLSGIQQRLGISVKAQDDPRNQEEPDLPPPEEKSAAIEPPALPPKATYQPPMGSWRNPPATSANLLDKIGQRMYDPGAPDPSVAIAKQAAAQGRKPQFNAVVKAPAIKVGQNLYVGKPGQLHADIALEHPEIIDSDEDLDSGFIGHDERYLTRAEATRLANEYADSTKLKEAGFTAAPAYTGEAPVQQVVVPEGQIPLVWVPQGNAIVDPARFQYKQNIDPKTGVQTELGEYNPQLVGEIKVWWDADNKKLYVVHGHHRVASANKAGAKGMMAQLWDSGDKEPGAVEHNVTEQEAKARAAIENFAAGSGTATDAASFIRNRPGGLAELQARPDIKLTGPMMQQAVGLSKLTAPIWHDVAIGKLKPEVGAVIGRELDTPRDQVNAWKTYTDREDVGRPYALQKFEDIVRLVKRAPSATVDPDAGQLGLGGWGKQLEERSTFEEQADILGYARRTLNEQGVMGKAVKKKGMLEKAGETRIDVGALSPLAELAKHRLGVVQKFTNSHPGMLPNMDAVMNRYSVYLAEKPSQRKVILNEAFEKLMEAADKDLPPGSNQPPDAGQESLF